jgi:hypothetical protein
MRGFDQRNRETVCAGRYIRELLQNNGIRIMPDWQSSGRWFDALVRSLPASEVEPRMATIALRFSGPGELSVRRS